MEIGTKIVSLGRYVIVQVAEVATQRELFADMPRAIDWLGRNPTPV